MSDLKHHAVTHPGELLAAEKRLAGRVNDWAATHLAAFFGLVWTVWFFIIWPLASLLLPKSAQSIAFFISSGWIQLWALPLLNYVGNRTQAMQAAQSDAQHTALVHIATVGDGVKTLLAQNTDLTQQVHGLATETHELVVHQRLEPDALAGVAADAKAARSAAESAFVGVQALAAVTTGPQPVLKEDTPAAKKPRAPKGGEGSGV